MKVYQGTRGKTGIAAVTVQDTSAPALLAVRRDLRNHSPDGFEWGYAGSGPAQLALAILADHFGPGRERLAEALHQDFEFAVVTGLPREGWTLTGEQIGEALCRLATEDGTHFWARVVGSLDGPLFQTAIEATGQDPQSSELEGAAAQIIARAFVVTEDFARTRVAEFYAGEGRQE